jgi:drug/metabolite transporter (DMT)-like permease
MGYLLPLAAAVLQAASLTVDKTVLSLRHVSYKVYTGVSFPLLVVIDFVVLVIVRPVFDSAVLVNHNLLFLLLSAAIAIGTNLFYYRALKEDSLGEIQTWTLLAAFPTIMLASAVFADERRPAIVIAALVAGAAVAWSHWRKHHFRIAKKTVPFLFWALAVYPLGSLLNKELLAVWNPVGLEFVRDVAIAVVLGPLFYRQSSKVPGKAFRLLVVTNLLSAAAFIIQGYSVQRSGIIFTGLVYSLQPLIVYFSSILIFKDRFDPRKALAFGVVVAAILAVRLLG